LFNSLPRASFSAIPQDIGDKSVLSIALKSQYREWALGLGKYWSNFNSLHRFL
jgi:hypothetical protein